MIYLILYITGFIFNYYFMKWCIKTCYPSVYKTDWVDVIFRFLTSFLSWITVIVNLLMFLIHCPDNYRIKIKSPPKWL